LENPVKIRPLPEIDLARIAPLPIEQKRRALEQLRLGRPPYSYAPVRQCLSDLLNVQAGLVGSLPRTPWHKITETIARRAKSDAEQLANLRVAKGLFDYADEHAIAGRRHDILSLSLGLGTKVVFWHPVVLTVEKRPLVPFFDPRRAKSLTFEGRRFVFSVMHEHIRSADPDFAEVALGVVQFSLSEKGPRIPIITMDDGVRLFSFDDLDQMVRETYELWTEICEDRAADVRRRAGGKDDGFI
jgi:hypothetical protein